MSGEIPEDSYVLSSAGLLGGQTSVSQEGKHLGSFNDTEDALTFVSARMEREQFYPSIVWVSDHGNWWFISPDGAELFSGDDDDDDEEEE